MPSDVPGSASQTSGATHRRIGRYVLYHQVGVGGMGVVYRAYDTRIGRVVAVKVLRAGRRADGEDHEQLLREAQALGRLSHPNVVQVFDASTSDDAAWIAMEFVTGQTLGDWCRERRRPWREVLAIFQQVGSGLAAIHAAHMLHRDIKPSNIMIDEDGRRVRVMDLGLVRTRPMADTSPGDDPATATGTPAYMSPEQLMGAELDVYSDQYSFCVTLWEALYAERPFSDATIGEHLEATLSARSPSPPKRTHVPPWVLRILRRGLAPRPEQRFADMESLLRALAADPTSRHRLALGSVAALTIVSAALVAWMQASAHRERAEQTCRAAGDELLMSWNDRSRDAVRRGLLDSGVSFAATTVDRTLPILDAYAMSWQRARIDVCRHTSVHDTWAAPQAERARACLAEAQQHFSTLIELLSVPGTGAEAKDTVQVAVVSAARLPPVAPCLDADHLVTQRRPLAGDERVHQELQDVRGLIVRAGMLDRMGRYAEALTLAEAAQQAAGRLGQPQLRAAAALECGTVSAHVGDIRAAEALLQQALFMPGAADDELFLAEATARLAGVVGYAGQRFDDGLRWGNLARVFLALSRDRDHGSVEASIAANIGLVYLAREDHRHAVDEFQLSLTLREEALGPDHPEIAEALNRLGAAESGLGDQARAVEHLEHAFHLAQATLGADHPEVASILTNLGIAHTRAGELRAAQAAIERAMALHEALQPPDLAGLAGNHSNLAGLLDELGSPEAALLHHRRAVEFYEQVLGPDHPGLGMALNNLAASYSQQGRYEESIPVSERALAIFTATFQQGHRYVFLCLDGLGRSHVELGHLKEAIQYFERAVVVQEKLDPPEPLALARTLSRMGNAYLSIQDPRHALAAHRRSLSIWQRDGSRDFDRVAPTAGLGLAHLALDQPAEAVPWLTVALDILEAEEGTPSELAEIRFALARALWSAPQQHDRAAALALAARADYRASGMELAPESLAVAAWLRKHRIPSVLKAR